MNLREARFRKGITQWDLRMRTGIQQTRISLIERGYLRPSETEVKKFAKALGVKPTELQFESYGLGKSQISG